MVVFCVCSSCCQGARLKVIFEEIQFQTRESWADEKVVNPCADKGTQKKACVQNWSRDIS